MMASIAAIFHWSKSEIENLNLDELLDWYALAIEIHKKLNGIGDD